MLDEYLKQKRTEEHNRRVKRERREMLITGLVLIAAAIVAACLFWASEAKAAKSADELPSVSFAWVQPREVYEAKIDKFLGWFFQNVNPRKLKQARSLVPTLLDATERHGVNPSLVAAMVTLESSWQPASVGKLGEVGLLQVMRSDAPLTDPTAQLDHGLTILKQSFEECGTTIGAVSKYATGRSCKEYKGARLRIRMAAKIEGM